MKRLLLSTAILGATTVPALAQEQSIFREAPDALEIRASDFMGMRVYTTETAVEGEEFEGIQEGWEDIGEINDIVMDRDGEVQAVLVDIGGFLGIGERTVAVSMDALRLVSDSATAEEADDFFLVMNASREALEAAPEYREIEAEGMTAEQAVTETDEAIEQGGEEAAAAAVEETEEAGDNVTVTTVEVTEETEETGEEVAEETAQAAENAAEETGEEVADAGAEVADEAADAGEEVAEEADQLDMTDTQENHAEATDEAADVQEEGAEETTQLTNEAADESADQAEATAEGTATETEAEVATEETAQASEEVAVETTTETEMAAEETAAAATEGELTTADTQEEVIVSNVPADTEAVAEGEAEEVASAEVEAEAAEAEQTSAEVVEREPIVREGFVVAGAEDMTADRLQGAAVYDVNDERVGEVGEILLSEDGQQVEQLVIDVGGFLGLGEKPVALDLASLDILRQDGGEEIRVYVSQTEEELEAMERYEVVE